jgi:O-antigen/teichoic acid export membrane protein
VLIFSSGQALTALVGIASATVLTRVFSQLDYASYRETLLCYTFAVPFVTLGFDRALYHFLPDLMM